MAKRRLDPPSAADMAALDEAFRSETTARPNPNTAPISQVVADAASAGAGGSPASRLDRIDAERLRDAQEKGLIVTEIPLAQISTQDLVRDRTSLNPEELDELVMSIAETGLRLPIEVYQRDEGGFSLLSGYRRLIAMQRLAQKNPESYGTIKAFVRPKTTMDNAFRAMVEENEIRSNLSHFERGRISVLAAKSAAFPSTEAAIAHLFAMASRAKRSKIRSFAEVFETLGDVLSFAETLTERQGLRLSGAIKQGGEAALRSALEGAGASTPQAEWEALDAAISKIEAGPVKVSKTGRPKASVVAGWAGSESVKARDGITLLKDRDDNGYVLRIRGSGLDEKTLNALVDRIAREI